MPRSPAMTSFCSRFVPHDRDDLGERGGVTGVAGRPGPRRAALRSGQQPVLDLQPAFLRPGSSPGGPAAASASTGNWTGRTAPSARGWPAGPGGGGPARPRSRPGAPPGRASPSPRRCGRGTPAGAQVGGQGSVGPPGQGGQLGRRGRHPGDDQCQRQAGPGRPAGRPGRPSFTPSRGPRRRAVPAATGDPPTRLRRHQAVPLSARLDRVHRCSGRPDRLARVSCAPCRPRGRCAGRYADSYSRRGPLVRVNAPDPGHVHRRRLPLS